MGEPYKLVPLTVIPPMGEPPKPVARIYAHTRKQNKERIKLEKSRRRDANKSRRKNR